MEGFKSLPKMQCFKEGGSVKAMCYGGKMKKGGHAESKEMKKDIAQDKKVVKKAIAMHDKQEHPGEKTDLSKLKKGGRMKKEVGTVKKYKAGGAIEMKKDAGDKDDIKKIKQAKPKKAAAPSAASKDVMNTPKFFKKGGSVKKCNEGGSLKSVDTEENPGLAKLPTNVRNKMGYAKKGGKVKKYESGGIVDTVKAVGKKLYENVMGTPEQNKAAEKQEKEIAEKDPSSLEAKYRKMTGKKKGGKIKKFADGGSTGSFTPEEEAYLGGADRTDPFILARMRSALGPRKQNYIPNANPAMDNRDVGQATSGLVPGLAPMTPRPVYSAPNVEQDSGLAYPQENELRTAPMAPRPIRRPAAAPAAPSVSSTDTARLDEMARGQGVFSEGSAALPSGKMPRPQSVGKRFFTATPEEQAASFGRGAEARKNLGKRVGRLSMPSFSDALDRYKS